MSFEEVLESLKRVLLPKQLNPIEQFAIKKSWLGQAGIYSDSFRQKEESGLAPKSDKAKCKVEVGFEMNYRTPRRK